MRSGGVTRKGGEGGGAGIAYTWHDCLILYIMYRSLLAFLSIHCACTWTRCP